MTGSDMVVSPAPHEGHGTGELGLTERDWLILRMAAAGRTYPEIAQAIGVTAAAAGQLHNEALTKLGTATGAVTIEGQLAGEPGLVDDMPNYKQLVLTGRAALVDLGHDPDEWVDDETDAQLRRGTSENTVKAICWGWGRTIFWCGRTGRRHNPMTVGSVRKFIRDHWEMRNAKGVKRGRYGQPYAPSTVELTVYIISMVHNRMGWANPVAHPLVARQLAGYRADFEAAGFRPDVSDPISPQESVALARSQDLATVQGLRNAAMFRLQFDTGARVAEMCHIQMQDLKWLSEDRVLVTFTRTKTSRERTVAVQATPDIDGDVDPVRLLLRWYRAVRSAGFSGPGPLFRTVYPASRRKDFDETGLLSGRIRESEMDRHAYEMAWNRAVANLGLAVDPVTGEQTRHLTTHSNRSGLITSLVNAGVPLEVVAKRTGHSPASPVIHGYYRDDHRWGGANIGVIARQPLPGDEPDTGAPVDDDVALFDVTGAAEL